MPRLAFSALATPYLPLSEAVFGAIGLTIGTRWSTPSSSARVFRIGFVVIELAMMLIVIGVLKRAGRSAWWAALYAWHPLPIAELAGSGHQEVIGVACLVGSLAVFTGVPRKTWRWTMPLALSALGKPITLPAGAIMLRGRPLREWFTCGLIGAIVIIVCIAPLWLIWGDHGRAYQNWRATVDQLGQRFAHFGGVYEAVLATARQITTADCRLFGIDVPPDWLARNVCLAIFAAAAIGIFLSRSTAGTRRPQCCSRWSCWRPSRIHGICSGHSRSSPWPTAAPSGCCRSLSHGVMLPGLTPYIERSHPGCWRRPTYPS